MVSTKDLVMPGVATILLVRSLGAVYLVEMQVSLVRLVIWEVQSEQESGERARDCVVILGMELEDGEDEDGSN